jgi:hypothetical protein
MPAVNAYGNRLTHSTLLLSSTRVHLLQAPAQLLAPHLQLPLLVT